MKKLKCKVCGTRFAPTADKKYIVEGGGSYHRVNGIPVRVFNTNDCFDCPTCGCQIIAGNRLRTSKEAQS